jgi:hypothetical protein
MHEVCAITRSRRRRALPGKPRTAPARERRRRRPTRPSRTNGCPAQNPMRAVRTEEISGRTHIYGYEERNNGDEMSVNVVRRRTRNE